MMYAASHRALAEMVSRETRELAGSFRFRVTAVLTLSLMALSALAGSLRYQAQTAELARLAQERTFEMISLNDLLERSPAAFKPAWKLAFLSDGRQWWTPDVYTPTLNVWRYPELVNHRETEPGLDAREPLDWTFVIRVILSMAAFVLGYDAACGKGQRALSRMVLSYPVTRRQVVAAKLLAVWFCVAAPFVLGVAAGLAILPTFGGMAFSGTELLKCAAVVLIGLWASAFFAAVAVWISILAREAVRSLTILALLWVTAVVVVPGAGGLLARTVLPLPTDQEAARGLRQISRQVEDEYDGPGIYHEPRIAARDGYVTMRETSAILNDRFRRQERERRQRVRDELEQVELAHDFASVSPMFLIQELTERLIGTGSLRDRDFVEQAWDFGENLAERVREIDDTDPASPCLWMSIKYWDLDGLHVVYIPRFVSECLIEPGDLPRFAFLERSLRQGWRAARVPILLFALITAAVSILLLWSCKSFNVGTPG